MNKFNAPHALSIEDPDGSVTDRLLSGLTVDSTGCWLWQKCRDKHGYGKISIGGKIQRTHRVMWALVNGPIPEALTIDHKCRNRPCCNPEHLELVTHKENLKRRYEQ